MRSALSPFWMGGQMLADPPTEIAVGGHRYRLIGSELLDGCTASATIRAAVEPILQRYETSWLDLIGHNRFVPAMRARAEIASMLRRRGWSLAKIGKLMRRHHTTVLHMIRMAPQYATRPVSLARVPSMEKAP